ncbi:MAG: sialate O-acetylesterase [Algibacter sp.]|uniref:sialate O-acetylesterase n=1 Tax=Algibacter sp. TaxID=1872428 RepID=UPI003297B274
MKKNYSPFQMAFTFCLLLIPILVTAQRDIYLVIGQSNTSGRGTIEAQDMTPLTGVDLFNATTWEPAENTNAIHPDKGTSDGGFNRYSTVRNTNQPQGLNYAYTFGRMLNEVTGNQIGLVVNAIGGSKITEWEKGATEGYYAAALSRINAALAIGGSNLKGILWHQGEGNRNSTGSYLSRLEGMINNFRTDLGIPDLPVIVGQISKQRTDNGTFNTIIKTIADSGDPAYIPYTDYVTSDGLQTLDRTHFNANGQRVLGYRYAAKVLKMIYGYTYVENQKIDVTQDAFTRGGTNADIAQEPLDDSLIRVKETSTNASNTRRGLLEFDVSAITGTSNRLIVDASLIMNGDVDNGPVDINFYDITTGWNESEVTFNSAPSFLNLLSSSTTTFNIDSADADGDLDVDELIHGGADLTEFIKDEYDLGSSTIALGLMSDTDGSPQFKFSSKEDTGLGAYILVSYIDTSVPPTLSNNKLEGKDSLASIKITNPVNDELIISSDAIIKNVSIHTITGQQLKTKDINSTSGTINVTNLMPGTYIVVFENHNKKTSKLIVKK